MDLGALRVVLSMATSEFTGPAKDAGETFRSSGSLIQATGSSIKSAIGEALNGTPLSEFGSMWGEVAEKVGSAAGEVEGAVEKAGSATRSAFSSGANSSALTESFTQATEAVQQFSTAMTNAVSQIQSQLGSLSGSGGGLEALDTELQTTAADAEAAANEIATAMSQIDTELEQTGTIAQTSGTQVNEAMSQIVASIGNATAAGAGLATLNGELSSVGTAAEAAGSSSAASGAAMGGAFALAPQIALITGLTMALSKVPEAIDAITDAGKDYDESVQTVTQTTGMATESASTLLDVFQHYGIPVDQATKLLDQMSKAAEASTDGSGAQAKAFADLGVTVQQTANGEVDSLKQVKVAIDGTVASTTQIGDAAAGMNSNVARINQTVTNTTGVMKSANEIFFEVGGALAAMSDGVEKNNDEMAIFGRSGAALNEMLQTTASSTATATQKAQAWADMIALMQQQAIATGHYLGTDGYDTFEKYQDASRDSSDALATLKETLGNDLIPVMTIWDDDLAKSASWMDEKVVPAIGHGVDAFKQIWSEIGPVRSILGDLSSFAGGEFSEAFTQLGELLDGPFGDVLKLLAGVVLVGFIAALVAVVAPVVAIATALDLTIGALNDFGDVLNKATQWGKELYDSMKQAGVDFIQGLEDGIDSKVDDLMSDVKSIPTNILSTFETELGISSPSTKGIGIGANFAGAVGLGITQNASMVNAAVSALGQGMTTTGTSMAVASGAHMVSAMMGSGGSQQATQQVVIHNYMGNKPIETVVGTAMNGVFRQQSRRQN